jgi:hypothetical protein
VTPLSIHFERAAEATCRTGLYDDIDFTGNGGLVELWQGYTMTYIHSGYNVPCNMSGPQNYIDCIAVRAAHLVTQEQKSYSGRGVVYHSCLTGIRDLSLYLENRMTYVAPVPAGLTKYSSNI